MRKEYLRPFLARSDRVVRRGGEVDLKETVAFVPHDLVQSLLPFHLLDLALYFVLVNMMRLVVDDQQVR